MSNPQIEASGNQVAVPQPPLGPSTQPNITQGSSAGHSQQTEAGRRLLTSADQNRQTLGLARSGSVKQKLNLENTRLKINVENLSSLINVHQNNEARYRVELDRYREKLLKYKQKIKQKDLIIAKLLTKLERKVQIDSGNMQNLIFKLHDQHVKAFKTKIKRGETVQPEDILSKYEELVKDFTKQEKDKLYLQTEKQDLEATVKQLKQSIKNIGEGKAVQKQSEIKMQNQNLKIKIAELSSILEKEKKIRNSLVETVKDSSPIIDPEVKALIVDVERERAFISDNDINKRSEETFDEVSKLKQKLAQSQSNFFNEKEARKGQEKYCNLIEEQLQQVSKKIVTSNINLETLQEKVEKIQKMYEEETRQLQDKTNSLLKDEPNLEEYKLHIDETSKKFAETIQKFAEESASWAALENQYQERLENLEKAKRELRDQIEMEKQKRKLFEVKIMGQDENMETVMKVDVSNQEKVNQYLDQRIDAIVKESINNKKQNESLCEELGREKKAYEILEDELKYTAEKLFKVEKILKENNISTHSKTGESDSQGKIPAKEDSQEKIDLDSDTDIKVKNSFLESQIKELRAKYIDIQMQFEEAQKEVERLQDYSRRSEAGKSKIEKSEAESKSKIEKSEAEYIRHEESTPISFNTLPEQIKSMPFQDLAVKYEQIRNQLVSIKQKMSEAFSTLNLKQGDSAGDQKRSENGELIPSENENEEGNQSVDEDTYRNINEEMDRLITKNKDLEEELIQQKLEQGQNIKNMTAINGELKDKLKEAEEINANLSNIVVHLESELTKYQNIDSSGHRPSDAMDASSKSKNEIGDVAGIEGEIEEKKRQFQDMLKSADNKSEEFQSQLRELELEIRSLEQQQQRQSAKDQPQQSQKSRGPGECPNCETMTKLSSELVSKLQKIQESKESKLNIFKAQMEQIESQIPLTGDSVNIEELQQESKRLRLLVAEVKTELSYQNKEREQFQNQIKNLREVNEELVSSIHEKEKSMLKLRTDLYRQNFDQLGIQEGSVKKIQGIFEQYEKKIQELERTVIDQEKKEVNISDLYDTINYLNAERQELLKAIAEAPNKISQIKQPEPTQLIGEEDLPVEELKSKYNDLVGQMQKLSAKAAENNFKSVTQMFDGAEEQKSKNIELMRENNRLQNKISTMNSQYEEYFKKMNEGKTYEILQEKEKEIDDIKQKNEGFQNQLDSLEKERKSMFEENEKINQDLKNIEENIHKLTGGKITGLESTLPDPNNVSSSNDKVGSSKDLSMVNTQSQYILEKLTKKIDQFKETVQKSSHKARPNFDIMSFQEIQSLEDVIIILLDRLHYAWNMVEERTTQYNELRDEMNIISMECMKNGNFELEGEKSRESSNKLKQAELLEERYEEVLAELVEYENQNKRLEKEVNRLKQQLGIYKKEVEDVQSKCVFELKSESSDDLPYSKQALNRVLQSNSLTTSPIQKQLPQIIKMFLLRIKELEGNLENIQVSFDEKNRKLESLIQKQKSFISERQSRVRMGSESENSQSRHQEMEKMEGMGKIPSIPINIIDEKSYYSMNSAKLFKQIEELTKNNDQLRESSEKYKKMLDNITKIVDVAVVSKSNASEDMQVQFDKLLSNLKSELNEENRDNSGFDLENDEIVGSSLSGRGQGSQLTEQRKHLQEIEDSLRGPKSLNSLDKNQEEATKTIQANTKFLEENKFIFQELFGKLTQLEKQSPSIDAVKSILIKKLSDQELQQILYLLEPEKAIKKIIDLISSNTGELMAAESGNQGEQKGEQKEGDISIQDGEWVETAQLEAIISQIYPTKSELCLIVANSINMLMMAETKEGILKAVQFLFTNLRNKQNDYKDQMRRRDESVADYGRKLQKLLATKYCDDDSQDKSEMLNENSFRRGTQIKSENELMGEGGNYTSSRNNLSSEGDTSQNYSQITYENE